MRHALPVSSFEHSQGGVRPVRAGLVRRTVHAGFDSQNTAAHIRPLVPLNSAAAALVCLPLPNSKVFFPP